MAVGVIGIIAQRIEWQSTREQPSQRLKWVGLHAETGEVLTDPTEYPLSDAALVLVGRGVNPDTLVTMRHEGSAHDSFVPMPLHKAAAPSAKREKAAQKARTYFADKHLGE